LRKESLPKKEVAEALRQLILRTSGSPELFGVLKPVEDLAAAGVTQCQHYLPLVAEAHRRQTMDHSDRWSDSPIFGWHRRPVRRTHLRHGFELSLPFFSDKLRQQIGVNAQNIDLYKCTFHPDLPGL